MGLWSYRPDLTELFNSDRLRPSELNSLLRAMRYGVPGEIAEDTEKTPCLKSYLLCDLCGLLLKNQPPGGCLLATCQAWFFLIRR